MSSTLTPLAATIPTQLLIGGQWRAASDGATIEVLDPAYGETIAAVASGSPAEKPRKRMIRTRGWR